MPAGKFQISAVCSPFKRTGEPLQSTKAKVPKASELTLEQGPKAPQAARNLPATAPVVVCCYKITDCAGDLWEQFNGQDQQEEENYCNSFHHHSVKGCNTFSCTRRGIVAGAG